MANSVHRLFANYAKAVHHPSITLGALGLAVGLGLTRWPFLQQLQPFGEFYIALLQICVLPYLLATIPLSARSALNSGIGAMVAARLLFWLLVTLVVVSLIAVLVSVGLFKLFPIDQDAIGRIGALFGATADRADIELALNAQLAVAATKKEEAGLVAIVPTNVFAALTANDSLRVIIFAAIFGVAMVVKERHAGTSIFGVLEHIQSVCLVVFQWIHLLTPIGVVALIAPQVANIGPNIYSVLAPFAYTFVVLSTLLIMMSALVVVLVLRLSPRIVFAALLEPIVLAAATKNSLVCIPAALEALHKELKVPHEPCELYIPVGFVTMQFGSIVFFIVSTLFIGHLMSHTFSAFELVLVAGISIMASFATIGSKGIYALAPMAVVLRPFGLSYELALPLMIIIEPIANLIRVMLNVALNCHIPVLAAGREPPAVLVVAAAAK